MYILLTLLHFVVHCDCIFVNIIINDCESVLVIKMVRPHAPRWFKNEATYPLKAFKWVPKGSKIVVGGAQGTEASILCSEINLQSKHCYMY